MFKVDNADFIADKLAAELLPDQEFREVLRNAIEAVERRMAAENVPTGGLIQFDVDWYLHELLLSDEKVRWYISCADNGDGMNRSEIERYTTTLAVQGAGGSRSIRGNQGMGLKISGPTRHKAGVLIRSIKGSERTAVRIGWDGFEYGMVPIGATDETVVKMPPSAFPDFVNEQGSGTVVSFLGNDDPDNTFVPPGRPNNWLFTYLNRRFFRLTETGIEVQVRVPTGGPEDWPHNFAEAADRMRKKGGRSFNMTNVYGTGEVWDAAARKEGGSSGIVRLAGGPSAGVPEADLHWWVLPSEGSDVTSRTHGGGSIAVLYQNELHDWRVSSQANPFFARLGVLFGKSRITFVLEPKGPTVSSDFARAHVLIGGTPVFESEAWLIWASQFQAPGAFPEKIKQAMKEEQNRLQEEDPDRIKRITDRLKEVMQLLRPKRFRPASSGEARAGGPEVAGPGSELGEMAELPSGDKSRRVRRGPRGIGVVLGDLDDQNGTNADPIDTSETLKAHWITEAQSGTYTIVKGGKDGLHDRAAALAGMDGRTAPIMLLNTDFRGYQVILRAINEWANPEGDEAKAQKIVGVTQEWIEQKMVEAVQDSVNWITERPGRPSTMTRLSARPP